MSTTRLAMRRGLLISALVACGNEAGPELDASSCAECSIELEHVVTLDLTNAEASPWMFSSLVHLQDGSWTVVWARDGAYVMQFDPDGRYRGLLMRKGEGPGESKSVTTAWTRGDTLWTWDAGLLRCSAFLGDSLVGENECPYPRAHDVVTVPDGIIVRGPPRLAMQPLRHLDQHGAVVPFGPDTLNQDWDFGSIAPASEGVWWTQGRVYELEWWVPGEEAPRRVIRRTPKWWRLYAEGLPDSIRRGSDPLPKTLAGPSLWSIWQSDGILWTSSFSTFDATLTGEDWLALHSAGSVYTFLEAMTTDGKLLASRVDSTGLGKFTNDGLIFFPEVAPEGHVNLGVYRPRLLITRTTH